MGKKNNLSRPTLHCLDKGAVDRIAVSTLTQNVYAIASSNSCVPTIVLLVVEFYYYDCMTCNAFGGLQKPCNIIAIATVACTQIHKNANESVILLALFINN